MNWKHWYRIFVTAVVTLILGITMPVFADKPASPMSGTDFWVAFMSNNEAPADDESLDLSIYIVLDEVPSAPVAFTIEVGGNLYRNFTVPAGTQYYAVEHITPALVYLEKINDATGAPVRKGLRVYTDDEVTRFSCYAYNKQGVGNTIKQDASIVFPAQYLKREYYVLNYQQDNKSSEFAVIATKNNTIVTITPAAPMSNGWMANSEYQVRLNAGEVCYLASPPATDLNPIVELSGTKICSDKDVAVFAANELVQIPQSSTYGSNSVYEQLLPIEYWGQGDYYLALLGHTKLNAFYGIAEEQNMSTTVTANFADADWNFVEQVAGGSPFGRNTNPFTKVEDYYYISESDGIPDVHITTDYPVLINSYLPCGNLNPESFGSGRDGYTVEWGNPANAIVPSWSQRTKRTVFFTRKLTYLNRGTRGAYPQAHLVQIITAARDTDLITVDGVTVEGFTVMTSDPTMAYTSYNIDTLHFGAHEVETTGDGFVGTVYGFTHGLGYMYTLGFNPAPNSKSLVIAEDSAWHMMSPISYDIPYDTINEGWFQRQLDRSIPIELQHLDTAYVCDSTRLHYIENLPKAGMIDSIAWWVFDYGVDGKNELKTLAHYNFMDNNRVDSLAQLKQRYDYLFALEPQKDLKPSERDPYRYFQIQAIVYNKKFICQNLEASIDTFRTMTRVARAYNDTIARRVICVNDTVHCFYDNGVTDAYDTHDATLNKETVFMAADGNWLAHHSYDAAAYHAGTFPGVGDVTFVRHYTSIYGCDSIMSFQLHICDTSLTTLDTTICQNHLEEYRLKLNGANSQLFDKVIFKELPGDWTYRDTLRAHQCDPVAEEFKDYKFLDPLTGGCDSIIELTIHVGEVFRDTIVKSDWCAVPAEGQETPDPNAEYVWYHDINGDGVEDSIMTIRFSQLKPAGKAKYSAYFSDTLRSHSCLPCREVSPEGGCDSIIVLHLTARESFVRYTAAQYSTFCDSIYNPATHSFTKNEFYWRQNASGTDYGSSKFKQEPRTFYLADGTPILSTETMNLPAGSYLIEDRFESQEHCDSIWKWNLTINPVQFHREQHSMTDKATYAWDNHTNPVTGASPWVLGPFSHDTVIYDESHIGNGKDDCAEIYMLTIRIGNSTYDEEVAEICDNETYTWLDHELTGSAPRRLWDKTNNRYILASELTGDKARGIYAAGRTYYIYDSLQTTSTIPADSIWCLKLTVHPTYVDSPKVEICQGDFYTWHGTTYGAQTGTFRQAYHDQTIHSCDSSEYLTITVHPVFHDTVRVSLCQDSNYVWYGSNGERVLDAQGNAYPIPTDQVVTERKFVCAFTTADCDTCHSSLGCDSVYVLYLTVRPSYINSRVVEVPVTACTEQGVYDWVGHPRYSGLNAIDISQPGHISIYDTLLIGDCQCDSVVHLDLTVISNAPQTLLTTVCQNSDPFTLGTMSFRPDTMTVGEHIYRNTISVGGSGCEYYEEIRVKVDSVYRYTENLTLCQSEHHATHLWHGKQLPYNEAGVVTYYDSLKSKVTGCDSIYSLTLTVTPAYYHLEDTVYALETETITWQGKTLTNLSAGDYVDYDSIYRQTINNCDSIRYLRLIVTEVDTICQNTPYPEWNGHTLSTENAGLRTYRDTLTAPSGRDSIASISLLVLPSYRFPSEHVMSTEESFRWRNHFYVGSLYQGDTTGTGAIVIQNSVNHFEDSYNTAFVGSFQCDSVYTLTIRIGQVFRDTTYAYICDSRCEYEWRRDGISERDSLIQRFSGDTLTAGLTYIYEDHKLTSMGFDSVFYLSLKVYQSHRLEAVDTVCQGDTYLWKDGHEGHTYYSPEYGSIITIPTIDSARTITIIDSLKTTGIFHNPKTGIDHVVGCDSVWRLSLYVAPVYQEFTNKIVESVYVDDTASFAWEGKTYGPLPAGDYKDYDRFDTTTALGCDSIRFLRVIVALTDTICKDSLYTFHGEAIDTHREAGVYYLQDTLTAMDGSDSIAALRIYVPASYAIPERYMISDEEYYQWQGRYYVGANFDTALHHIDTTGWNARVLTEPILYDTARWHAYYDAAQTLYCDSVYYLTLRVGKVSRDTTFDYVCNNCTYQWMRDIDSNGTLDEVMRIDASTLRAGETYFFYDSLKTSLDYDSIYNLSLTVYPVYGPTELSWTDTTCRETPYRWDEMASGTDHTARWLWDVKRNRRVWSEAIDVSVAGTYTFLDSLYTRTYFIDPHGVNSDTTRCDSIWQLTLFIPPTYNYNIPRYLCDNDSLRWQQRLYVGSEFKDSLLLDPIALEVDTIIYVNKSQSPFRDTVRYSSVYHCDSIYNLALTIGGIDRTYLHESISDNDSVWSFCHAAITGATWNCRSGRDFRLAAEALYDSTNIRLPYQVELIDTLTNIGGCDSIIIDTLTVLPEYHMHLDTSVCSNVTFHWRRYRNLNHERSGTYTDTLRSVYGTDSIFYLHLTTMPSVYKRSDRNLCKNDTIYGWQHSQDIYFDPVEDAGATYVRYTANYETGLGCDSVIEVWMTYYDYYNYYDTVTICAGSETTWRGKTYSAAGDYYDSLKTAFCGCDSVYHLHVITKPTYYFDEYYTVCESETPFVWSRNGVVITDTIPVNREGEYIYHEDHLTPYGCDSNYVLHLSVVPVFNLCDQDTLGWQSYIYKGDNYEQFHGPLILDPADNRTVVVVAESNDTITRSISYPTSLQGLDSVFVLTLVVHPTPVVERSFNACTGDSTYLLNAKAFDITATGLYIFRDTLPTVSCGCDSIIIDTVRVDSSYYFHENERACAALETTYWAQSGRTYSADYTTVIPVGYSPVDTIIYDTVSYSTVAGCDSVYYYAVQFDRSYFISEYDTVCSTEKTYRWHNKVFDIPMPEHLLWSGDTTYVLWDSCTTAQGCDSIYMRSVNVLPTQLVDTVRTICLGDTFYLHERPLTASGIYRDTVPNRWGCDLITTVYLTVVQPTQITLSDPIICADAEAYTIAFHATPASMPPLRYSLYYSDYARDTLGFTDIIDRDIPEGDSVLYIEMPPLRDSMDYPRPGNYMAKLYFDNGICLDSNLLAQTKPFQIRYPNWVLEQHWNDMVAVLSSRYNGGYDFASFQWYRDGVLMIGETNSYVYEPHWLSGAYYSAALVRLGETEAIMTCELPVDTVRDDAVVPTHPYLSVVPTLVLRANPQVHILSANEGDYTVYNSWGAKVRSGHFVPDTHVTLGGQDAGAYTVDLPSTAGTYVFYLTDSDGLNRSVKVIVQ